MKRRALIKNGRMLAVIRPKDPQLALSLTKEFQDTLEERTPAENELAFNEILRAQEYQFVGIAEGFQHKEQVCGLLNRKGERIGKFEPGDSFVDYVQLMQSLQGASAT